MRNVAILFKPFGSLLPNTFKLCCFQYFEIERTWSRLSQRYDVRTKFDIYFVLLSLGRYLCWLTISHRGCHSSSSQCYYHWVDTSTGWLLVPEDVIRPVVSAEALTWFTRYVYYWNLQFLIKVFIIKTKILLPQVAVTSSDFGYPV
jgi:hypothetical protein